MYNLSDQIVQDKCLCFFPSSTVLLLFSHSNNNRLNCWYSKVDLKFETFEEIFDWVEGAVELMDQDDFFEQ